LTAYPATPAPVELSFPDYLPVLCALRGPKRLRLSEFVQISEFFSNYITDICQTSESFAKSVNLKKERAERTIPSVEATGILR